MKSPYNFIVTPLGSEYNNTLDISGVEITVNTSLENSKYVNRLAIVKELPIYYSGEIQVNDVIILHHNVFRIYYDMKGRQTKSPEYFRDGIYIVSPERVYMYMRNDKWNSHLNYCFVKPIETIQDDFIYNVDKEQKHTGILIYPTKQQLDIGFKENDLVAFTKNSEYAFEVGEDKLYRMYDRDVVLKLN